MDTTTLLADQLDWHWTHQLRPRLDGLTDAEYFWQPVPGCWTVHPDGTVDFTYPPRRSVARPSDHQTRPEPFTTIAWRLAHVIVGVLAVRNHAHFGGPEASYQTWRYATDAATALRQLDDAYRHWIDGVRSLDDHALARPVGPAEGPWADQPMAVLVLHINREVIHHGAEIACLRDFYAHRKEH